MRLPWFSRCFPTPSRLALLNAAADGKRISHAWIEVLAARVQIMNGRATRHAWRVATNSSARPSAANEQRLIDAWRRDPELRFEATRAALRKGWDPAVRAQAALADALFMSLGCGSRRYLRRARRKANRRIRRAGKLAAIGVLHV